jgi:hypothetical protein
MGTVITTRKGRSHSLKLAQEGFSDYPVGADVIRQLRSIAVCSLARMYYPQERLFAFRLRRNGAGEVLEGVSRRYTAIVLIGLAGEDRHMAAEVLGRHSPQDVCDRLLDDIDRMEDLGEVALTTWAARALGHPRASAAINALRRMDPGQRPYPTVELSWALTALSVDAKGSDMIQAEATAKALLGSFKQGSGLFPHWSVGYTAPRLRAHVSCFADLVYPIQALSYYHLATGNTQAAEVACRCADRMCELQGPAGQWWWHYDHRTGQVLERYPVYSVHQEAMAPMVLFALAKACGQDHSASIKKSVHWLFDPPEKAGPPVDLEHKVIWRKVARREPRRLVRGLQAAASCLYARLRVPAMEIAFPPTAIDYESRPYEMGWILHTWPIGGVPHNA